MNTKEQLKEIYKELDEQQKSIGEDNIKNYRICPLCLNYVKRSEYNIHFDYEHGGEYECITIGYNNV